MVDYVRLAATATRLIKANGVPVTLTKPVTDDYEPEIGSADARSPGTFNGFAVRDPDGDYQQTFEDGTRRRIEFRPLLVSMPDAAPEPGDAFGMDGKPWIVSAATPVAPGPILVYYKVLIRTP